MEFSTMAARKAHSYVEKNCDDNDIYLAAQGDMYEAMSLKRTNRIIMTENPRPLAMDADLFHFLAILYIANELKDKETIIEPCPELQKLVNFGQSLSSKSFGEFDGSYPAMAALEVLYDGMDEEITTIEGDDDEGIIIVEKHEKILLSDLLKRIVCSPYFASYPIYNQDIASSNVLGLMEKKVDTNKALSTVRDKVRKYYMNYCSSSLDDCKHYFEECTTPSDCESSWGHLTVEEAISLLDIVSQSFLARSLFTTRPPRSIYLSHLIAVIECTMHARLWLLQSKTPVFGFFRDLTYHELGLRKDLENEVLRSSNGFGHRMPRCDDRQRRKDELGYVI